VGHRHSVSVGRSELVRSYCGFGVIDEKLAPFSKVETRCEALERQADGARRGRQKVQKGQKVEKAL
jgi:hypothetical protein